MHQQWLTVAGLAADFLGFCLLLREWWIAFFHDTTEVARAQQRVQDLSFRRFSQSHMPEAIRGHAERTAHMQDEMQARQAHQATLASLAKRKSVFVTATVLIVIGFLLQLVGAVPGCCPPWITPQG